MAGVLPILPPSSGCNPRARPALSLLPPRLDACCCAAASGAAAAIDPPVNRKLRLFILSPAFDKCENRYIRERRHPQLDWAGLRPPAIAHR
jgi:hypothetical protein